MTTHREEYMKKIRDFDSKIKKLEEVNKSDIVIISELEKEQQVAMNAVDIDKSDDILAEMERKKRKIEVRKTQIMALRDKDHPERQKAKSEYLDALKVNEKRIIEEHTPDFEEVMAARDIFIRLAASTVPLYNEFHRNAREYHRAKNDGSIMTYPMGLAGGPVNYQVTETEIYKIAEKMSQEADEQSD